MKHYSFTSSYFIIPITEHKKWKNKILKDIEMSEGKSFDNQQEKITRSDWNPADDNRYWVQNFYKLIEPYMLELMHSMKSHRWWIYQAWYQQYEKGDFHGWHNHAGAQWAGVYFVELPNSDLKTKLFNQITNEIINIEKIEEGDLLLFPAYLAHKSLPNQTSYRKTVIAFNSCFWDFNDKTLSGYIKENVQ